ERARYTRDARRETRDAARPARPLPVGHHRGVLALEVAVLVEGAEVNRAVADSCPALPRKAACAVLGELEAGDHAPMNSVRPVGQAQRARDGEERRQREVERDAGAAVDLDRLVDHVLQDARRDNLDRRDLAQGAERPELVELPRGEEREEARLVDRDAEVRDLLAVAPQVEERLAERDPREAALDEELQRELRRTDAAHCVMDATGPQAALRDLEALARPRDEARNRQPHVLEPDLAVPVGLVVDAEDGQHPLDGDAGRVERHQHHAVLVVPIGRGVGQPHEDGDLAVRMADPRGPPFLAVEHDLVALNRGGRLNVRRIGGGDVGLRHAERRADAPFQERLQPLLLLFGRAEVPEDFHVAAVGRVAVEDLGGEHALAHLFGDPRVFRVVEARAALRVRQEQVPETLGAGLGLQGLDRRRYDPRRPVAGRAFRGERAERLQLDRANVITEESADPLREVLGAGRRAKVHALTVRPAGARLYFTFVPRRRRRSAGAAGTRASPAPRRTPRNTLARGARRRGGEAARLIGPWSGTRTRRSAS